MNYWLNRLREYWNDKKLAEKCGLELKDICVHEENFNSITIYPIKKCIKCGEFYR